MCIHTGQSEQTFVCLFGRVIHANGIFMHPRISAVESSLRSTWRYKYISKYIYSYNIEYIYLYIYKYEPKENQ